MTGENAELTTDLKDKLNKLTDRLYGEVIGKGDPIEEFVSISYFPTVLEMRRSNYFSDEQHNTMTNDMITVSDYNKALSAKSQLLGNDSEDARKYHKLLVKAVADAVENLKKMLERGSILDNICQTGGQRHTLRTHSGA